MLNPVGRRVDMELHLRQRGELVDELLEVVRFAGGANPDRRTPRAVARNSLILPQHDEMAVRDIDGEAMVRQEIRADDRLRDVGDVELPGKSFSSEDEVHGLAPPRRNRLSGGRHQLPSRSSTAATIVVGWRQERLLRPSVDEETETRGDVNDAQKFIPRRINFSPPDGSTPHMTLPVARAGLGTELRMIET